MLKGFFKSFKQLPVVSYLIGFFHESYLVTFYETEDMEVVHEEQWVRRGEDAIPPDPPPVEGQELYEWVGDSYENVTEARELYPIYTDKVFEVIFRDQNKYIFFGGIENVLYKVNFEGVVFMEDDDYEDFIRDIKTSNQGDYAIVATNEYAVHKVDTVNGSKEWTYDDPEANVRCIFVDDDNQIYAGDNTGTVHKINNADGSRIWTHNYHDDRVRAITVDSSKNVYSAGNDSMIYKVDINGEYLWDYAEHDAAVRALALDKDENYLFSGSNDHEVHRIIVGNGNKSWDYKGHGRAVTDIVVDDDDYLYTTSLDEELHKVRQITSEDEEDKRVWKYTEHINFINAVDIDLDGNLYTASNDGTVHKIDKNGNKEWKVDVHEGFVNTVHVFHDYEILKEEDVVYGQDATPPEVDKEGYSLVGWDKDYTDITRDKIITVIWETQKYTVVFWDHNNNPLVELRIVEGLDIDEDDIPEAPDRTDSGYEFIEWEALDEEYY